VLVHKTDLLSMLIITGKSVPLYSRKSVDFVLYYYGHRRNKTASVLCTKCEPNLQYQLRLLFLLSSV